MPAIRNKPIASKTARKLPAPKKPSKPFPGYMTDEWYEYIIASMRRRTPAETRRDLVKCGIIDKKGNYTAPYRNDEA
jgi:hypothetical protein